MNNEDIVEKLAQLVEKNFDEQYLDAMSPNESFVGLIRKKQTFPAKWVVSEIDKDKLTGEEQEFLDYLREVHI